jgi:hypothetical protein
MDKLVKVFDQRTTDALEILDGMIRDRKMVLHNEIRNNPLSRHMVRMGMSTGDYKLELLLEERSRIITMSVPVNYYF